MGRVSGSKRARELVQCLKVVLLIIKVAWDGNHKST
jgi:hypothetical protein